MKLIPLTQGKSAMVDDADFDWLSQWKWCASKAGRDLFYAERVDTSGGGRIRIKMHRLILSLGASQKVDHIDRNSLNNQRSNLRICQQHQNCGNRRMSKRNTSGFKGVTLDRGKWVAQIGVSWKILKVGVFRSAREAAVAYDAAALKHFGEFACTNQSLGLL